jgi:hypothetical protein
MGAIVKKVERKKTNGKYWSAHISHVELVIFYKIAIWDAKSITNDPRTLLMRKYQFFLFGAILTICL